MYFIGALKMGSRILKVGSQIFATVEKEGRKALLETEAKEVCREYSIPVTEFELARSEADAIRFAHGIGYPVVLKVVSPDVVHKSDVGGVEIGLKGDDDVRRSYRRIMENVKKNDPKARIVGITVQEMASPSTEVIVGAVKDPQFGPVVMFGLGGIFVEVLKDVAFRVVPFTENEASDMIREIKAYAILKGYRNTPPADTKAIADILLSTSQLMTDHPEIKEIDLNPILVYEKGAKAVDARIIIE
jgi:acetyl-CoA synthetase (ADP-forming)